MSHSAFDTKWSDIRHHEEGQKTDEKDLFVEVGDSPITQRQLNLYYYFIFIEKYLKQIQAKDSLEIGCGRGTMSLYLQKYLQMKVSLLDNESEAIALAKSVFEHRQALGQFYVADALDTKLPEHSFDSVVSIGLAEHIDNVKQLFAEQFRLLKPGGVMISLNIPKKFSVQYINNFVRAFRQFFHLLDKNALRKDYYRNSLQPSDYLRIAQEVGFTHVEVTHVCPVPIFTNIKMSTDKKIAGWYRQILRLRSLFMKYPFKTNSVTAQAHFLVGYKK